MHVIRGQGPGDSAIDIVNSFSSRVWHWRAVRSGSKGNLRQTPVLQAVFPDVCQPIYCAAEKYGIPRFGPRKSAAGTGHVITRHIPQIDCLVAGQADPENALIRRVPSRSNSEQVIPTREQEKWEEKHAVIVRL